MNRIIVFIFIIFMLPFTVYAGDLPEAVITMEDTDVFIGEIIGIEDGYVTVDVSGALFDCYEVDTVTFSEFEYMTFNDEHRIPAVGDYLAAAAEFKDGAWNIAFSGGSKTGGLIAKSDSLDPDTLTLFSGGHSFIERMNGYINDGTYSLETRRKVLETVRQSANERENGAGVNSYSKPKNEYNEQDEYFAKIASETEIVLPVFTIEEIDSNDRTENMFLNWSNPYIKYPFILLLSAILSYVMTKIMAGRFEGRRR